MIATLDTRERRDESGWLIFRFCRSQTCWNHHDTFRRQWDWHLVDSKQSKVRTWEERDTGQIHRHALMMLSPTMHPGHARYFGLFPYETEVANKNDSRVAVVVVVTILVMYTYLYHPAAVRCRHARKKRPSCARKKNSTTPSSFHIVVVVVCVVVLLSSSSSSSRCFVSRGECFKEFVRSKLNGGIGSHTDEIDPKSPVQPSYAMNGNRLSNAVNITFVDSNRATTALQLE
jgi:hypothetical protein